MPLSSGELGKGVCPLCGGPLEASKPEEPSSADESAVEDHDDQSKKPVHSLGVLTGFTTFIAYMLPQMRLAGQNTESESFYGAALGLVLCLAGYVIGSRYAWRALILVPLVSAVVGYAVLSVHLMLRESVVEHLRPGMQNFFEMQQPEQAEDYVGSEYPLRPKFVVLQSENGEFDRLHFMLPGELRADRPEEVGTVIFADADGGGKSYELQFVDYTDQNPRSFITRIEGPKPGSKRGVPEAIFAFIRRQSADADAEEN